jgi:hypothetical protein
LSGENERPPATSDRIGLPAWSRKETRPLSGDTSAITRAVARRTFPSSAVVTSNAGTAPSSSTRIRLGERAKSPSGSALTRTIPSLTTCSRTSAAPSAVGCTVMPRSVFS